MIRSPNGRLIIWNQISDEYNYNDLKYNFEWLDQIIGDDGFVGEGTGTAGVTANRRQDLTGVASRWLGPGDTTRVYYKASDIDNPDPLKAARAPQRNLYRIIYGLVANQVPLGTIVPWWRPSDVIDPPAGWVICDGRTLQADDHSYGNTNYQVPDLRNKFILGADEAKANGAASAAADNLNYADGNNTGQLATNAPGIGYDSIRNTTPSTRKGKNAKRDLSHTHAPGTFAVVSHQHSIIHYHQVALHSHVVPQHIHGINHVHVLPDHYHAVNGVTGATTGNYSDVKGNPGGAAPNWVASGYQHVNTVNLPTTGVVSAVPPGQGYHSVFGPGYWTKGYIDPKFTSIQISHDISTQTQVQSDGGSAFNTTAEAPFTGGSSDNFSGAAAPAVSGTSADAGFVVNTDVDSGTNEVDMRPAHVGLLYIMKVKKYFNLIDDDRELFDSL